MRVRIEFVVRALRSHHRRDQRYPVDAEVVQRQLGVPFLEPVDED